MGLATLLIIQGSDQGNRFEIHGFEPLTIGRGIQNIIRLNDSEVSRQHAQIEYVDRRCVFTDRGSSNGSLVNGQPVSTHDLRNGDRIGVGSTLLLFQTADDSDQTAVINNHIELLGLSDSRTDSATDHSNLIVGTLPGDQKMSVHDAVSQFIPGNSAATEHLRALYQISEEALSPTKNLDELLQSVLRLTVSAVAARRGCILLREGNRDPVPRVFQVDTNEERLPISMTIVRHTMRTGAAVRTSDAQHDRRFGTESVYQAGIAEALCVPMHGYSELLGAIYLDRTSSALVDPQIGHFGEEHLRLVLAIGRQAALIVESKRFEQSLVKAERFAAMGQTVAMMSHHIKNILQGVRGGSHLISMGMDKPDENLVRKGQQIVDRNATRIYNLVLDLLSYSKEREPQLKFAQLNDTVGDVCELMSARACECGVVFESDLGQDIPSSLYDAEGIHRAVLNVVTNAIDAVESEDEPRVDVRTYFDDGHKSLVVMVADNGPGIPDDLAETIFDVFESSKGARGTGLGLAVSRKILSEHGGTLTFETEAGKGTCFILAWPLVEGDGQVSLDSGTLV